MVRLASDSRGGQVKEVFESFHVVVERTSGVALLLVLPLAAGGAVFWVLQKAGRSLWSCGTERRDDAWARDILDRPVDSVCPTVRRVAENHFRYKKL